MVYFSEIEKKDLTISIIVITLIYAFSISGHSIYWFLILIPLSLVTVGISFILHELGHKVVAQRYGFVAEFRKWTQGLILAVITSLLGFLFLAPGAVYIGSFTGQITTEENGIISIAGPLINIGLAILFLLIGFSLKPFIATSGVIVYLLLTCQIGFSINSYLALFNMLPLLILDGVKVFRWNKLIWLVTFVISGLLTYMSYTINFLV
ncbi:MAG: site-2 protease family protein [Methanosphaera sp.]|nr:site-2 protease family protein [Methanosphaera sp.]